MTFVGFSHRACKCKPCSSRSSPEPAAPYSGNRLFLGQSLTYPNYRPKVVDSLAVASGLSIRSASIASPGFGLIDHWDIPARRRAVEDGHYDVVILLNRFDADETLPAISAKKIDWLSEETLI